MNEFSDILSILGYLLRALTFIALGFGLGKFFLESYKKAVWQVQAALIIGFFGMVVGLTAYSSAGSMGGFALGAGVAFLMEYVKIKDDKDLGKK
jgi:hypothetical protein